MNEATFCSMKPLLLFNEASLFVQRSLFVCSTKPLCLFNEAFFGFADEGQQHCRRPSENLLTFVSKAETIFPV